MLIMYSIFALILVASVSKVSAAERITVILSFDGFHTKYIKPEDTPCLYNEIMPKAAGPPYMTSVFPTQSIVTHFSMATGAYPEDHGVYANEVFDTSGGDILHNVDKQFHLQRSIIPIWTENEYYGKHSAIMMWPGSEFSYEGIKPTYIEKYAKNMNWEQNAAKILDWAKKKDEKLNLVMAYFEDTPNYDKTKRDSNLKAFKTKVDGMIKKIYDGLTALNLTKGFNMIIMSGHGKEPINDDQIMIVDDYIKASNDIKVLTLGPLVFIKPKKGSFDAVLNQIKNHSAYTMTFSVETRTTFDKSLRINAESLKGIIVLVAKYGFTFLEKKKFDTLVAGVGGKQKLTIDESGYYNYDLNMAAFFMATGPNFKRAVTTKTAFSIVEVYGLLKKILDLPLALSFDQGRHVTATKAVKLLLDGYLEEHDCPHLYYREDWNEWRQIFFW